MRVRQGGTERFLVDIVVESVCGCRDEPNDNVQLQVVKALLTAVSSKVVAVQEQSLLLAVRACYHVFLVSRNAVNRNTAKASLKQLLAVVFTRMEQAGAAAAEAKAAVGAALLQADAGAAAAAATSAQAAVAASAAPPSPPAAAAPVGGGGGGSGGGFGEHMYHEVAAALGFKFAAAPEVASSQAAAAPQAAVVTPVAPATAPVAAAAAVAAAPPISPGAFGPGASSPDAADLSGFPTPRHRDAFLLFRALCRLSMKGGEESPLLPPGAVQLPGAGGSAEGAAMAAASTAAANGGGLTDEALLSDPVALASKLLSLDLILGLLDASGPAFQSQPRCIGAIKQYLCMGLLKNILSTIPAVSSLSLKVFLSLMRHFKQHIAPEVEVFISTIFLRTLASPLSSFEQKAGMLAAFRSIAADAGGLLEIFLNYDCAEGRQDIFEASVQVLASIAQGRTSAEFNASQATVAETAAIRHAAMAALGAVMDSCAILADQAALQTQQAAAAAAARAAPSAEALAAADAADAAGDTDDAAPLPPGLQSPGGAAAPAPTAAAAASSALARQYDEQRRRRALHERAAAKFSVKARKGIEYMQSVGLCDSTPESVARVFHELRDCLDKTAIGDYLGEEKAWNVTVLHRYVDAMDFTGLSFDMAIRKYLAGFRIPGEAQKIDRIMEKFAERFHTCNPSVFPSADTAFILAYSVIMLQTDAHNPNIKQEKKMTKAGFIGNNRCAEGSGDARGKATTHDSTLPPSLLQRHCEWRRRAARSPRRHLRQHRRDAHHAQGRRRGTPRPDVGGRALH